MLDYSSPYGGVADNTASQGLVEALNGAGANNMLGLEPRPEHRKAKLRHKKHPVVHSDDEQPLSPPPPPPATLATTLDLTYPDSDGTSDHPTPAIAGPWSTKESERAPPPMVPPPSKRALSSNPPPLPRSRPSKRTRAETDQDYDPRSERVASGSRSKSLATLGPIPKKQKGPPGVTPANLEKHRNAMREDEDKEDEEEPEEPRTKPTPRPRPKAGVAAEGSGGARVPRMSVGGRPPKDFPVDRVHKSLAQASSNARRDGGDNAQRAPNAYYIPDANEPQASASVFEITATAAQVQAHSLPRPSTDVAQVPPPPTGVAAPPRPPTPHVHASHVPPSRPALLQAPPPLPVIPPPAPQPEPVSVPPSTALAAPSIAMPPAAPNPSPCDNPIQALHNMRAQIPLLVDGLQDLFARSQGSREVEGQIAELRGALDLIMQNQHLQSGELFALKQKGEERSSREKELADALKEAHLMKEKLAAREGELAALKEELAGFRDELATLKEVNRKEREERGNMAQALRTVQVDVHRFSKQRSEPGVLGENPEKMISDIVHSILRTQQAEQSRPFPSYSEPVQHPYNAGPWEMQPQGPYNQVRY
ncbi:hypothetical protein C8Q77DRAFT_540151 [Trametes polyzona]|nr:hypothetical protein C8Q77DRAFT_540151 [Trametes polyzona]